MKSFSFPRLLAMITKEFIQMKRDKATFGMIIGIPVIQLVLFGFAINTDPKHLPTYVVTQDVSPFTRSLVAGLQNSGYFDVQKTIMTQEEAHRALQIGTAQFVVNIPEDFSRKIVKNEHPTLLIEADATDPATTGVAIKTVQLLTQTVLNQNLKGTLNDHLPTANLIDVRVHAKYNPTNDTHYNIVPGLIGVILSMTLVSITAIAIVREKERGTIENLLATPIQPLEIIIGKILPFIIVGYIQVLIVVVVASWIFNVPITGSLTLFLFATLPFITALLSVGLMVSTIAKNQLQAMQTSMFFFLPSLLLSGFMFPFRGMPSWAQTLGECLPLTHYLRIDRGILLKGNTLHEIWPDIWPIILFMIIVIFIGLNRFRRTLD